MIRTPTQQLCKGLEVKSILPTSVQRTLCLWGLNSALDSSHPSLSHVESTRWLFLVSQQMVATPPGIFAWPPRAIPYLPSHHLECCSRWELHILFSHHLICLDQRNKSWTAEPALLGLLKPGSVLGKAAAILWQLTGVQDSWHLLNS